MKIPIFMKFTEINQRVNIKCLRMVQHYLRSRFKPHLHRIKIILVNLLSRGFYPHQIVFRELADIRVNLRRRVIKLFYAFIFNKRFHLLIRQSVQLKHTRVNRICKLNTV